MKSQKNFRRLARVAIANVDTTVHDVTGNLARCLDLARQAAEAHCHLVAYPEQVLGGYPAEDLSLRLDFVREQMVALLYFARESANYGNNRTVHVLGLTVENHGQLFNCAAVVCDGKILGIVPKEKLPTYGEFYEGRTTTAGIPGRVSTLKVEIGDAAHTILEIPFGDLVFDIKGLGRVAVVICEDSWDPDGPMRRRAHKGADLIVVLNSSPQRAGVYATRKEMLATRSSDYLATLISAYQVGGNDGLVMDGGGLIFQNGRLIHEAPRFISNQLTYKVVDLDVVTKARMANTTWRNTQRDFIAANRELPRVVDAGENHPVVERYSDGLTYPFPSHRNFFLPADTVERERYLDELVDTMLMSLDGYIRKTGVFRGIAISLSGGWDSALATLLARRWAVRHISEHSGEVKPTIADLVHCFSQPTSNNTATTNDIAANLAADCGVSFKEKSIQEAYESAVRDLKSLTGAEELERITLHNIQARIRGERMWGIANEMKLCWIQTGNMTEKFLGFTTVGGDQMGCFSLIGNLPKTVIFELVRRMTEQDFPLGSSQALLMLTHSKSSPGLESGQTTEGDLMPFGVADAGMWLYLEAKLSIGETIEVIRSMWTDNEFRAMDPSYTLELFRTWMLRLFGGFHRNVFKWVFNPLTTHLGRLDLDRERNMQIPVVHKVDWANQVEAALIELKQRERTHRKQ